MKDGKRLLLSAHLVTITVREQGKKPKVYKLDDLAKLTLMNCDASVADGKLREMPVRSAKYVDDSGLVFEVPMPVEDAREMGEQLQLGTKVLVAAADTQIEPGKTASGLLLPPGAR